MDFFHRRLLAQRLRLCSPWQSIPVALKKQLDAMLAAGITWPTLSRILTVAHRQSVRPPNEEHVHAFHSLIAVARRMVNHGSYRQSMLHDVRNSIDFGLYLQELKAVGPADLECPRVVHNLVLHGMRSLEDGLTHLWREATAEEAVRQELIVRSGQQYQRHVYPDFSGCDELFYFGPFNVEDTQLEKAKKLLGLS